jgi:predicted enzyme related to lactoylglutathione lyase
MMSAIVRGLVGMGAALLLAGAAQADGVSFNGGRVGATDSPALAKFYADAFGLKEVNRLTFPNMIEIMMNFGDTVEAAKKNPDAQIVIMQVKSVDAQDTIPHLIFTVTDMAATVTALKAAGGKMDADPKEFGKTGTVIGMGTDPAGNHIELIQPPKKK